MIKKAISLGVSKINVNTECQLAFRATRAYIEAGKDLEGKGFKLLAPGTEAIKSNSKRKNGIIWICWKSLTLNFCIKISHVTY